mgnify:CR=1 FL=1
MKRLKYSNVVVIVLTELFTLHFSLFTSCTQDSYEKGEGEYSLMRGDFAEAHTNAAKEVDYITTDDGDILPLKERKTAKWVMTADTTYRCMLYYNKVNDGQGRQMADLISIGQVPCPRIIPLSEFDKDLKTDPVKFESIWMSRTGKYVNLSLQLMVGATDDTTAVHQLSFVTDTLMVHPDSRRTLHVLLHHDQNNVPEYYTTQSYVSLLVDSIPADSVRFQINTYGGPVIRTLPLR